MIYHSVLYSTHYSKLLANNNLFLKKYIQFIIILSYKSLLFYSYHLEQTCLNPYITSFHLQPLPQSHHFKSLFPFSYWLSIQIIQSFRYYSYSNDAHTQLFAILTFIGWTNYFSPSIGAVSSERLSSSLLAFHWWHLHYKNVFRWRVRHFCFKRGIFISRLNLPFHSFSYLFIKYSCYLFCENDEGFTPVYSSALRSPSFLTAH